MTKPQLVREYTTLKVVNTIPVFTRKQIVAQADKIITFLQMVHPGLKEDSWQDGCVEVRPLRRDPELPFLKSYDTWGMDAKDKASLIEFLEYMNGKGACMYYSLFAFDYHKDTTNSKGKKAIRGQVNKQNALYTTTLMVDFDNISYEDFMLYKAMFDRVGLESLVVSTGKGFQLLLLLNERIYDKQILWRFTTILKSKGLPIDDTIVDSARIARLPFTWHCKSRVKDPDGEVYPTSLLSITDKRYSLIDVFERISQMDSKIPMTADEKHLLDGIDSIKKESLGTALKKENERSKKSNDQLLKPQKIRSPKKAPEAKIENLRTMYPMIDLSDFQAPVLKMLQSTPEGSRNDALLFLVPMFKNLYAYPLDKVQEIMAVWGRNCVPGYENVKKEVQRIYDIPFSGKQGKYTSQLTTVFGPYDFDTVKIQRKNTVYLPNEVMYSFSTTKDTSINIYLHMVLDSKQEHKNYTIKDISDITGYSVRTIKEFLPEAITAGLVIKKRSYKRSGANYEYYVNPYISTYRGITPINVFVLRSMLSDLAASEVELYLYMLMLSHTKKDDVWASQKHLASAIGKTSHTTISKLTDKLHKKHYIDKRLVTNQNNVFNHAIYILLA